MGQNSSSRYSTGAEVITNDAVALIAIAAVI